MEVIDVTAPAVTSLILYPLLRYICRYHTCPVNYCGILDFFVNVSWSSADMFVYVNHLAECDYELLLIKN